jgi:hypothetical protein
MRVFFARLNRGFAAWVSERSYRLVPLVIVGILLFPPLAWGLSILDVLQRGSAAALSSALLAGLGLAAIGVLGGAGLIETIVLSVPVLLAGIALGAFLSASRSLTLTFQATVVGSILLVLIAFTVAPGANQIGEIILSQLLAFLEASGFDEAQLAELAELDTSLFTGSFLFLLVIMLLGALMLGYWWYSLLRDDVRFGADFRALKLGRVAGIALMLLVTLNLLVGAAVIQYAAWMAVVGFLFQGLAVLHARSHSDHWHWAVLLLVYLLLIPFSPLSGIVIMGLSAVGLLDNFFRLRAPAERRD